jgi:hypothetical protein
MMLFDMPIEKDEQNNDSAGAAIKFDGKHLYATSGKLNDVINQLEENTCVHWVSEGDWSMHDLLNALLELSGPANVYLSSYAFSEYPARMIADLVGRKIIRELYCLIDARIDVRSASALNLIKNCATRLELVNTHAKVTVIESNTMMIVTIGSANYTTNKRYECGVVMMDREAALFHKKWITDAFDKNK